jgi:hypothetical protein
VLGRVLGLCRRLCNTALEQRISPWQRARVSLSRYQQEAELTDIRAEFSEYAAIDISQTCSGCGVVVQKGLSVRWRSCLHCGTSLHRDHNAAQNGEE